MLGLQEQWFFIRYSALQMIRSQIFGWREVLQAVRPVLQEGFPTAGNWRSRSVPKAYPKGFPAVGNFGALLVKVHVVQ